MRSAVDEALGAIADLRRYLSEVKSEADAFSKVDAASFDAASLGAPEREWLGQALQGARNLSRRRNHYVVGIVSLYGYVERLIESLITAYIHYLNSTVESYAKLPEEIRKRHASLSLKVLTLAGENRFPRDVNQSEMLANLVTCLDASDNYRLNPDAFSYHSANCRPAQINALLVQLGLPFAIGAVAATRAFQTNWEKVNEGAGVVPGVSEQTAWLNRYVDDLVERRNEISHGVQSDDLESVELLIDRVDNIAVFVEALYEIFITGCAESDINAGRAVPLGTPLKIFNNEIVGIKVENVEINTGDSLIARMPGGVLRYRVSEIASIQINKVPFDRIDKSQSVDAGLRVHFHAKESYEYFVLPGAIGKLSI